MRRKGEIIGNLRAENIWNGIRELREGGGGHGLTRLGWSMPENIRSKTKGTFRLSPVSVSLWFVGVGRPLFGAGRVEDAHLKPQ